MHTNWMSRPVQDIICSMQTNKEICHSEMLILRGTIYARCLGHDTIDLLNVLKRNPKRIGKKKYCSVFKDLDKIETGIDFPKNVRKDLKIIAESEKLFQCKEEEKKNEY